ncbi:hypothetical protein JAAARDRAFT_42879 [Jaapia argillacea MUCL 33604]|uniref:YMC020W-like alpha/beta hydrolase domain-containing protein n=1 Tax=Jaapia argillacea MUCL 33604 TaxID=933084 RepID=A0A067P6N6_9AGAM|nr:hypothetical protein JAAARDRAFT_42879 [Jaapia argillacea MUCL 33604]
MSSTRRNSRRSSYSTAPPSWRSISVTKNKAQTTVSKVFAQPEQGKPLASAASRLPTKILDDSDSRSVGNRDRGDSSDSRQGEGEISGKGSPTRSSPPVGEAANVTEQSSASDTSAIVQDDPTTPMQVSLNGPHVPLTDSPERAPPPLPHYPVSAPGVVPFPAPSASSDSKPQAGPSSWFSSLGRAKGHRSLKVTESLVDLRSEDVASTIAIGTDQVDSTSTQPTIHIEAASPINNRTLDQAEEQTPAIVPLEIPSGNPPGTDPIPIVSDTQPSQPKPVPAQRPRRSWFASPSSPPSKLPRPPSGSARADSPSTSPPQLRSPTSPIPSEGSITPRPRLQQTPSIPSSIDEEVPPATTPTLPAPAPGIVQQTDEGPGPRPRISSLNPAASRFTLSIPLLGRPKVPLEKAVAAAQAEDVREVGRPPEPLQTPLDQAIEAAQGGDVRSENAPTDGVSASALPDPEQSQVTNVTTTTLLKVDSAVNNSGTVSSSWWDYVAWGTSVTSDAPVPTQSPPAPPSEEAAQAEAPLAIPDPPAIITAPEIQTPQDEATKTSEATKPPSVFSANTTQSQSSSAWYAPWAWYAGSSTALVETQPTQDCSGQEEKTESERVKEEALARAESSPESEPTSAGPLSPPVGGENGQTNPIQSTIVTHRSGWASFFTSTSLMMKTVTNSETDVERDEHGNEVMNIDDDEGAGEVTPEAGKLAVVSSKDPQPSRKSPPSTPTTKGPEPKKSGPPAAPMTNSDSIKRETVKSGQDKGSRKANHSPAPSKKSGSATPVSPRNQPPNLVLPTWSDTFHSPPRSVVPPPPTSTLKKTIKFMSGVLFSKDGDSAAQRKGKSRSQSDDYLHFGRELPRSWEFVGESVDPDMLRGCKKVVVIGIHGWFPGAMMRTVLGEPTGTSGKFVNMMCQALEEFQQKHGVQLEKVTKVPLEGEGTIVGRVDKLYKNLLGSSEWMDDLHAADAILIATHSQGSIVSTHLLDRLIRDGHIRTTRSVDIVSSATVSVNPGGTTPVIGIQPQRVCCLALCGIHLGPLRYLSSSSLLQPYIQYFESTAARELFDFQDTESAVSKEYVRALRNVTDHGIKMVYVASLNDQVVPIYSGLFTSASHPLILRALYIDGDAYHSSDFLSNLLVLLIRVLNAGISDSGLLVHLSEATAGSLSGVGHSTAYEELSVYSLAVNYLFLTNNGLDDHPELTVRHFKASTELNDYEIPWSLRDLVADDRVAHFFYREFTLLRDAFDEWHPRTTILRDIKRKLQPIQKLPSAAASSPTTAPPVQPPSKL